MLIGTFGINQSDGALPPVMQKAGYKPGGKEKSMKKIIGGKLYDTEKAKELGAWRNAGSWRDFSHKEETLYRKKTGEFFLHGQGGPMTNYAEATGANSWSGGERIMPLTFQEARKWAEEKLQADEYEAIFGEVVEDESKATVCYNLSIAAAETVKRRAAELGISASAYIESLIKT